MDNTSDYKSLPVYGYAKKRRWSLLFLFPIPLSLDQTKNVGIPGERYPGTGREGSSGSSSCRHFQVSCWTLCSLTHFCGRSRLMLQSPFKEDGRMVGCYWGMFIYVEQLLEVACTIGRLSSVVVRDPCWDLHLLNFLNPFLEELRVNLLHIAKLSEESFRL